MKKILIVTCRFDEDRNGGSRPWRVPQAMAPAYLAGHFNPRSCEIRLYSELYSGPLVDLDLTLKQCGGRFSAPDENTSSFSTIILGQQCAPVESKLEMLTEMKRSGELHSWGAELTADFFMKPRNLELARASGCVDR
jgi:hypothetical protein